VCCNLKQLTPEIVCIGRSLKCMQFHLLNGSCVQCKIKFAAMRSPYLSFLMNSVRQYVFKTLVHILTSYIPVDGVVPCDYT